MRYYKIALILLLSLISSAQASFVLKKHAVISEKCRVMFFEDMNKGTFFLEKFNLKDSRKFEEYQKDPIEFAGKERPVFSYDETTGFKTKNHIVKLEENSIIVKYDKTDESGEMIQEEVVLFEDISCE